MNPTHATGSSFEKRRKPSRGSRGSRSRDKKKQTFQAVIILLLLIAVLGTGVVLISRAFGDDEAPVARL